MKKIISSVVLVSVLLVSTSSIACADEETSNGAFGAFVYTPSTADGTIEGYKLKGGGMLGFLGGNKSMFSETLGIYGSYDMSYNSVDETQTSDAIYGYRIFNIGATYSPFDSVTLLGGIGVSWEYGEQFYHGNHYVSEEDTIKMNLHAGVAYNITDKYGAIVTYNTASSSVGIGVIVDF